MVMPGATDTSQAEQLSAALKAEEEEITKAEEQVKGALTEEEKASEEAAEPEAKEKPAEEVKPTEESEEEVLQLKPAELTAKIEEGVAAYLKTPEYAQTVQSEKDKTIAKEIKPFREKVDELEMKLSEAESRTQDAAEMEAMLETFQSGDETKIKKLVADNQAQRQRLTSIAKQADQGLMIFNAYLLAQENDLSLTDILKQNPASPDDLKAKVQVMVNGKSNSVIKEKEKTITDLQAEIAELKKAPLNEDGIVKPGGTNVNKLKGSDAIAEGLRREAQKRGQK